ncbi:putative alpha beta hydrolase fold-containing protein [Golovinomyces cichoracearum]|uniref:Putative alpha beta hydrolase fold-containing protein n=1 Tax=Golovinomyces cichoracearum TaxID=62708 RepID=A0A420J350_9PEZI|nr:putative alpha beta hydrolase fold-containing protein [Golovinomyces cichoracearum]
MTSPDLTSLCGISSDIFYIAGINTIVYGLDAVPKTSRTVSCLWLLHPRLQTKEAMARVASACISNWNSHPLSVENGLIAVSFDQRNHGSREVDPLANLSWRKGNERHAIVNEKNISFKLQQSKYTNNHRICSASIIHGTAVDTSLLIDHLGSYIFQEPDSPKINHHLILGVSLGGHSAWQVLLDDSRVHSGVIIIGCPDYTSLMSDRAQRSGRESAGPNFLGSPDFPKSLMEVVQKRDPRGIFFGFQEVALDQSDADKKKLRDVLDSKLRNKRILLCSGKNDNLVPYRCAEAFLAFLKNASTRWYSDGNFHIEDRIYPGIGHTFSDDMLRDTVQFVIDSLNEGDREIPSSF